MIVISQNGEKINEEDKAKIENQDEKNKQNRTDVRFWALESMNVQ